ncbi:MAG: hypothetical protein ABIJ47_05670 [Candidatus Bathyarchaeota archaeon]
MESQLHIALKKAVERHMAEGSQCWFESLMVPWSGSGSQRADVQFMRRRRSIYVECETRPSIRRLREKGRRRNQSPWADVYVLVVPETQYSRHDWRQLRGLFDKVYAYSAEEDRFTESVDLRPLGALRDAVLDAAMPVIRSPKFRAFYRFFWIRKNRAVRRLRDRARCIRCCMGKGRPRYYCVGETCETYRFFQHDKVPPDLI